MMSLFWAYSHCWLLPYRSTLFYYYIYILSFLYLSQVD
ncbi:unnamed protein product [Brassica rapa subsp. narinosa]